MFRGVKVSFLKEKTIFVGFISVLSSRSISNTGPSNRVTFSWVKFRSAFIRMKKTKLFPYETYPLYGIAVRTLTLASNALIHSPISSTVCQVTSHMNEQSSYS